MTVDLKGSPPTLETRREIAALAVALSLLAHFSIGIALVSAWVQPPALRDAQRPALIVTDVEVLDEPGSDAPIVDVSDDPDESLAQGPRGVREALDAPAERSEPSKQTEAVTKAKPTAAARTPVDDDARAPRATPSVNAKAPRASHTSASPAAAASSEGGAPVGDADAGGGQKRPELPSVMARFTHDLAEFGSGVAGWQSAPLGDAGFITVTLSVGAEGKLDRGHDPFDGESAKLPKLLVESVKRTSSALVTRMGSRDVLVKFKVGAVVSDGAAPEGASLKLSFDSYDAKTRRGGSTFVLGSGRQVTFTVELLGTTAVTPPP